MKIKIRSLAGSITMYRDLLANKVDFDRHYNIHYTGIRDNGHGVMEKVQWDELHNIEVDSIYDLFHIFDEFKAGMGEEFGHITVDIKNNIVYVLDSWIE